MKAYARIAAVSVVVFAPNAGAVPAPSGQAGAESSTSLLAPLSALTGTWSAQGDGFRTTLRYRWLLDNRVLEAVNDVHGGDGRAIARYRGMYAWDAGRKEIVFWVAGGSGEVHRGHAWWRDGVLWHEAEVSGGRIESYASAIRPREGRLEYFAAYGSPKAGPDLLDSKPILYTRVTNDAAGSL
jgi:hypothetical protein